MHPLAFLSGDLDLSVCAEGSVSWMLLYPDNVCLSGITVHICLFVCMSTFLSACQPCLSDCLCNIVCIAGCQGRLLGWMSASLSVCRVVLCTCISYCQSRSVSFIFPICLLVCVRFLFIPRRFVSLSRSTLLFYSLPLPQSVSLDLLVCMFVYICVRICPFASYLSVRRCCVCTIAIFSLYLSL